MDRKTQTQNAEQSAKQKERYTMMFIKKTVKQVEAENAELIRKNREHDNKRRAENTPEKRITKATAGAQRLLKRLERDGSATPKAREIVKRMEENLKVYFDCEAELAKKTIRAVDVAQAQAVTELMKKLPNCFPLESDAVHFAGQLTFKSAYDADMKATEQRQRLSKTRTNAHTQVMTDAEQIGKIAGLSGNLVEEVIKMGAID